MIERIVIARPFPDMTYDNMIKMESEDIKAIASGIYELFSQNEITIAQSIIAMGED